MFGLSVADSLFVDCLMNIDGHFSLISDPQQHESPFWTIQSDLPDNFIKGLADELFFNGTDALIYGLPIDQSFL